MTNECLRPSLRSYWVSLRYDSLLLDAQSAFGTFPSKQWISNVALIEKRTHLEFASDINF